MTSIEEDPLPSNEALEFLRQAQAHYCADLTPAKATLAETTLITLMAPDSGVVARHMKAVRKFDQSIKTVPTEMTRARRPYDWKKDRTADEGTTHETLQAAVKEGSLLHYAITASGEIFGSRVEDVVGRRAIMHVGFDSFDHINDTALKRRRNVYLLMGGATYAASIGLDRLSPDDADTASQIQYSLESIEFARLNIENDIHTFMLVNNTENNLVETSQAISRFARHNSRDLMSTTHIQDSFSEMEAVLTEAKRRIGVQ